ncbi:unnamed protein product [Orchesella dallaii]|uniref:ABC transporter G family member 23 n=2 Tax=Orchesella dallaii TaxID=48710 RepID=A0ABP1PSQ3_9HEXA
MSAHLKSATFDMESDESFEDRKLKLKCFTEGNLAHDCYSIQDSDGVVEKPSVVVVRNATKFYQNGVPVLDKLDMTVEQGTIYSLLGSSGCGKTTLLNCIVGVGKFTTGDLWLFGKMGRDCGIPGKSVGYMPQDYSLYKDFYINETFTYFGMLNGMNGWEIMKAMVFYTNLLKLPKPNVRVSTLSGGLKRRVSFAVALMHKPELLILDEPTVGVDPLVRESIWKYLVNLTKHEKTTVIITTHYVDEARCSDKVGIMRKGRLLAESSPTALLQENNTTSLEAAVLKLCRENENHSKPAPKQELLTVFKKTSVTDQVAGLTQPLPGPSNNKCTLPPMPAIKQKISTIADSRKRLEALVKKNIFLMMRNLSMLLIIIFVPTAAILTTIVSEGNELSHVSLGVVNSELNDSTTCEDMSSLWNGTCGMDYMSCKFMSHITAPTFNVVNYKSLDEAKKGVRRGEIWGFVSIPQDYSWEFYQRAVGGVDVAPTSFNKSDIVFRMDETSTIVARELKYTLYKAFQNYVRDLLRDCGRDTKAAEHSLRFKKPIFGVEDESALGYLIPSHFIGYIFFYPIITAGIRYVNEKREGTLERSLVSGVKIWEIFFAFSICELIIGIIRTITIYVMAVWIFGRNIVGSLSLQFLLGLTSTFMGVTAGFLFGAFCTEEIQVALLAMALFFPNILLSGMWWPLEGMPQYLRTIAQFLPCTLACESIRSMACRGWEFSHPNVWPGFASTFGYMVLFFVAAVLISSRRFIK